MCGSASDYGEQTAVRILLEAYIAVGEGLILDVLGSLDGEEAPDVFPKSGDDGSLSGSKQISGSARLELLGSGGIPDGVESDYGVTLAFVVLDELLDRLVAEIVVTHLLDDVPVCLILGAGVIGITVYLDPLALAERSEVDELQIAVLLILGVLVEHPVVVASLVPYVVCLENRASVRK